MNSPFPGYNPEQIADFFRIGEDFAGIARKFSAINLATLDPQKLADAQRRNMEALIEVNRSAAKSYEQIFRRQVEVLQTAAQSAQDSLRELSTQGKFDPEASVQIVRETVEEVIRQLSELTAEAAKANAEAFDSLRKQVTESAENLTGDAQPAEEAAPSEAAKPARQTKSAKQEGDEAEG